MFTKDFSAFLPKAKTLFAALFFTVLLVCAAFASAPNERVVADGRRCVELVFEERFAEAHQLANGLIRQFPDNPAGHFFRAAIFHYQMLYLRQNSHERDLYDACDRGISIGEQNRSRQCPWNDFFLGATIGVQGNFERVNGRLVSSLRLATRSMDIFREKDESIVRDVLYGTGVYEYWIGANVRLLWWMPGARDNRPRALENLNTVRREGIFTRLIVNYDLMEMYLNERRWNDAIEIANYILKTYPSNMTALWTLYEAFDAQRNTAERDRVAARISERIAQERDNEQMLRHFQRRTRRN